MHPKNPAGGETKMLAWIRRRGGYSPAYLRTIMRYEPESGHLYWTHKRRGRRMDRPAGCLQKDGRRMITFGALKAPAQEVVWAYVTGKEVFGPIRHFNGKWDDNRFENLFEDDGYGKPLIDFL